MNPLKVTNFIIGVLVWVATSFVATTALAVSRTELRWWESICMAIVFDVGVFGGVLLGIAVVKKLNTYVK